jgi:hypothetical protein
MLEGSWFAPKFYGKLPNGVIRRMYGPEYGEHLSKWKRGNTLKIYRRFGLLSGSYAWLWIVHEKTKLYI